MSAIEWTNGTGNGACFHLPDPGHFTAASLTVAVLLTNLDIIVVAGNLLVLLAFAVDRHLRTPTHYFIGSLAAADLALGLLVLPFAVTLEAAGGWNFGIPLCQIWLAVDVWLCTASIYGLIMVGLDRYIAVTRPLAYKAFMTHTRASLMIATAWSISLVICLPTFVVSSYRASEAVESNCQCTQMIHGPVYIVYSAVGSFFLPMAIIGYVYARIYITVRRIKLQGINGVMDIDLIGVQLEADHDSNGSEGNNSPTNSASVNVRGRRNRRRRVSLCRSVPMRTTLRIHRGGYREDHTTPLLNRKQSERKITPIYCANRDGNRRSVSTSGCLLSNQDETSLSRKKFAFTNGSALSPNTPHGSSLSLLTADAGEKPAGDCSRHSSAATFMGFLAVPSQLTTMWYQRMDAFHRYHQKLSSELGALRTVGIVTGCFVACWIGFCIVYTIHAWPECRFSTEGGGSPCVPSWLISTMVWLGYANSAINPLIYTASNEHFRRAFRILIRRGRISGKRSMSSSRHRLSQYSRD